jgi:hypothetical protein
MSFWKKLFGKNEQPVVEDNMVVDDEFEDSEIDADTEAESDNEFEEVGEDAEIESSTSDELVTDESVDEIQEQSESETESTVQSAQVTEESEVDADVAAEDEDETDAEDQEAKAKSEADAAEEQLRQELEAAETAALNAQLEIEKEEFLEDLSVLDGRILPQLKVPDWREELEFVKERYEPCDLSDHIVKVSKRRLTARQIDHELAQSRKQAYERYLERASRRFKEKIDEDALLHTALTDLSQWRSEQGKSVAWLIAERVNEEVLKAKEAEIAATSFVENNSEFTNSSAIAAYRHFSRRLFLIPVVTLYIMSVVGLTYSRFDWIMKFFPFFNLGLSKTIYMIGGVASYFLLANFWRYSKKVAEIQRKLVIFKAKYEEQDKRIRHAVSEHTRLSQQQPLVEPILFVLAKAYRVQLQSNVMAKVHATTEFESASLPACVTLARALNTEDEKMARLRRRALNILMTPGWRTNGLNDIARIHAESRMLDAHSLSLSSLDTDSMISATSAQKILLEAFTNTSIHDRVSKERLIKAIQEIHTEVLANWSSEDRPKVLSLRDDGFDKIAFRTSWLADEDGSEPWLPFLREILSEETAPFGLFNILDKRSELNMPDRISSEAVVPNYFVVSDSKVTIGKSSSQEVMPLDVVVRVDVSPWSEPTAFAVFANETKNASTTVAKPSEAAPMRSGGSTSA